MKKPYKPKKKQTHESKVKELAEDFGNTLTKQLPVILLKNGAIGYKDFIIKQNSLGRWGIHSIHNLKETVGEYNLKTCALMAAKAYNSTQIARFNEIKELDNHYQANHIEHQVYKKNIKSAKELDKYIILLNKLEESVIKTEAYKQKITRMFHYAFV
jgi:hypothetical protein